MRLFLLFSFGILLVAAPPSRAQGPPRWGPRSIGLTKNPAKPSRYVSFPLPDNIEGRVGDHLQSVEALEPFRELIDKALRDPGKFKLDPETLKKLQRADPKLQEQVKDWIAKQPSGLSPSLEDLKKLRSIVESPAAANVTLPPKEPSARPEPIQATPPAPARADPIREWLKDTMEQAKDSKTGDVLRDSPAWSKAIENLQLSLRQPPAGTSDWGLGKLTERLLSSEKLRIDGSALERLGKLKPANLPRVNWTMPAMSGPALPSVSTPAVPTAAGLGTIAVWLLGCGLIAALAWQASRWLTVARRGARAAVTGLGPWPLDPQCVATRAELVQVFDYLALLRLGMQARTWNHQAVARALAANDAACAEAAGRLAALYEQARYTDGADVLPDDDRDRARLTLAQLGGAALP